MLQRLPTYLLPIDLLLFVACNSREESTPTTDSTKETPKPTITKPEPTTTPEPKSDPAASPVGYWGGAIHGLNYQLQAAANLPFARELFVVDPAVCPLVSNWRTYRN